MRNVDPTVKKETGYIFLFSLVLFALMQSLFLIFRFWDITVFLGGLLGLFAAVFNFFLMGLFLQKALGKDETDAKNVMKLSQMLRMALLFAAAAVAYFVPCFSLLATVIPYLFPRIAVMLRMLFIKNQKKGEDAVE